MSAHSKGSFENKRGLHVEVRNGNVEGAIRTLNRKVKLEGIIKEVRQNEYYEKPSVVKRRKAAESRVRARKAKAKADL